MLNALSIDVEEWYHAELVRHHVDGEPVPQTLDAVGPILALLDRYDTKATFFFVGEVALRYPDLVRNLRHAGHEIGCHGMTHKPLWGMEPEDLRGELVAYREVMRGLVGEGEIIGYRAPTFSVREDMGWVFRMLKGFGYRYDSSVFPIRMPLYGVHDCPSGPYHPSAHDVTIEDPDETFLEFPMSVYRIGRWKIPVCGGAYLRAIPSIVLRWMLKGINRANQPFVLYLHPWETYPATPRVRGMSAMARSVTYYNISATLSKLERLLRSFRFAPLREVMGLV